VSGVVIANASLDIAFHDNMLQSSIFTTATTTTTTTTASIRYHSTYYGDKRGIAEDDNIARRYFQSYWAGLMDAKGDIQVNFNKKLGRFQYRFVITLGNKDNSWNYLLLRRFTIYIGGRVKKDTDTYIWELVTYNASILDTISNIEFYTTTNKCKMDFLQKSRTCNPKDWDSIKKDKYKNQEIIYNDMLKRSLLGEKDFPAWLSGYLEGKGYVEYKESKKVYIFEIEQKKGRLFNTTNTNVF